MSFKLQDLQADARYYVFGDSTNTQYGSTDLNRNINRRYEEALGIVLKANGDWQINGEISTTNLVAGQREYILPNDILKINDIYIKYESTGYYKKAGIRDPNNIYQEPDQADYGYYPEIPEIDLMDNSLFVYLPVTTIPDITDGLKIRYQTDLVELSGATDVPNLAEPFKRYISIGAAIDYCIANEMWNKKRELDKDLEKYEAKMLEHYSNRINTGAIIMEPEEENLY
ncbi:MAG: hypothetical protein V1779_17665 [bacterium]